jgi:glycosyltransferase involved in cell wall biosynthesis
MKVLLSAYAGEPGNRDAVLRVFGDGPDLSRVRRAAQRCGPADRLELVGSLPRDELLRQVRRCGVLLHPAFHDESPSFDPSHLYDEVIEHARALP